MCHMDAVVRPDFAALPPDREATVVRLQRLQRLNIARHEGVDLFSRGQSWGVEGGEHVAQRRHTEDARGDLLGTVERIIDEIDIGVGQRLHRGGRHRNFQPAVDRDDVVGRQDRLQHRAGIVNLTVDGKGFRCRWCVDRE